MPEATLEQRMTALEAAVYELQEAMKARKPAPDWLDAVIGSMRDEPAFDEVLALGRAIRQSDRPAEDQVAMRYLLDTDHISILQKQSGPEYRAMMQRIAQVPRADLAFCIRGRTGDGSHCHDCQGPWVSAAPCHDVTDLSQAVTSVMRTKCPRLAGPDGVHRLK